MEPFRKNGAAKTEPLGMEPFGNGAAKTEPLKWSHFIVFTSRLKRKETTNLTDRVSTDR